MKKIILLFSSVLMFCFANAAEGVVDQITVPGPLTFDGQNFMLAKSTCPKAGCYVQDYLLEGQAIESYTHKVTVKVITDGTTFASAVAAKEKELAARKAKDPDCVFDKMEHPDGTKTILFSLTSETEGGVMKSYVFNVIRYETITLKDGKKGLGTYTFTRYSVGSDIDVMLAEINNESNPLMQRVVQELAGIDFPAFVIK